ncbi:hypothetical protein EDD37DRAFT_648844 [Exophiala viscosa]|uniref:uncharacterized protein n=1 Tax=Exophiala viscosa TaxID=2486360 RepID=UPI0021900BE8|nr:hypothetical protein EDD37DRAFT_648844 [Exophiala viscosa]
MPGDGSEKEQQQNRNVSTLKHESSGSPERPSYSPVTPTLSQASLPPQDGHQIDLPQWMDEEPVSLPVSLDDNSDAIALRAALSILQIQRQRALQDMRDLDKMKKAALENPEQFVKDLEDGKLTHSSKGGVAVDDLEDSIDESSGGHASNFGAFPSAQDVTRCPPVEWAKYHVVGEPLDRMHEVQQHYPGYADHHHDGPDIPQPHVIAAPYRPFVDKLDRTRTTKKS